MCAKRQPPSATTSKRDETSSCTAAHTEDKTTLLDHSTATATTARLGYGDGSSTATPLSSHTTPLFLVNQSRVPAETREL